MSSKEPAQLCVSISFWTCFTARSDSVGEQICKHGDEYHREDQRPSEREPIRDGHRCEYLARHALHRKQRYEGDQDDQRGEQHRTGGVTQTPDNGCSGNGT